MTNRDDMVIEPSLDPAKGGHQKGRKVGGRVLGRLPFANTVGKARRLSRIDAKGAARIAAVGIRAAIPVAAAVTSLLGALNVALRLAGSRAATASQALNDTVLGESDDRARAMARTRAHFLSQPLLLQAIQKNGGVDGLGLPIDSIFQFFLREEQVKSKLNRDPRFTPLNKVEILTDRFGAVVPGGVSVGARAARSMREMGAQGGRASGREMANTLRGDY